MHVSLSDLDNVFLIELQLQLYRNNKWIIDRSSSNIITEGEKIVQIIILVKIQWIVLVWGGSFDVLICFMWKIISISWNLIDCLS